MVFSSLGLRGFTHGLFISCMVHFACVPRASKNSVSVCLAENHATSGSLGTQVFISPSRNTVLFTGFQAECFQGKN